jgi:hypothetical protein
MECWDPESTYRRDDEASARAQGLVLNEADEQGLEYEEETRIDKARGLPRNDRS